VIIKGKHLCRFSSNFWRNERSDLPGLNYISFLVLLKMTGKKLSLTWVIVFKVDGIAYCQSSAREAVDRFLKTRVKSKWEFLWSPDPSSRWFPLYLPRIF
jgi:hypothetical protein